MRELKLKVCKNCGAMIKIVEDCQCKDSCISCCGENMVTLPFNSIDSVVEKHLPVYETIEDEIVVTINHVMEKEHYIEWISMVSDTKEVTYYLKPNDILRVRFDYEKGANLYAYCNKHGLWKIDIK